jgi:hypothetical protein
VQGAERVEQAVLRVQLEGRWAGGAADLPVWVVNAGEDAVGQLLLEAAAASFGERRELGAKSCTAA